MEQVKVCPYCAETIKDAAIVCRFCGRELKDSTERVKTCPVCRSQVHIDAKRCPKCNAGPPLERQKKEGANGCLVACIGWASAALVLGAIWKFSALSSDGAPDNPTATTSKSLAPPTPLESEEAKILRVAPLLEFRTAGLLYQAFAPEQSKLDEETMVRIISDDYRFATNEFKKRDIRERVVNEIDNNVRAAVESRRYLIKLSHELPEYDFRQGGFATGLDSSVVHIFEGAFADRFPIGAEFGLTFSNSALFSFAEVPEETAQSRTEGLGYSRESDLFLEFAVQESGGIMQLSPYGSPYRIVARITQAWLIYREALLWHVTLSPSIPLQAPEDKEALALLRDLGGGIYSKRVRAARKLSAKVAGNAGLRPLLLPSLLALRETKEQRKLATYHVIPLLKNVPHEEDRWIDLFVEFYSDMHRYPNSKTRSVACRELSSLRPLHACSGSQRAKTAKVSSEPQLESFEESMVRRSITAGIKVNSLQSGPLKGGAAVLVNGLGAYWVKDRRVLAANGVASSWSNRMPYAPVGIDFTAVQEAVLQADLQAEGETRLGKLSELLRDLSHSEQARRLDAAKRLSLEVASDSSLRGQLVPPLLEYCATEVGSDMAKRQIIVSLRQIPHESRWWASSFVEFYSELHASSPLPMQKLACDELYALGEPHPCNIREAGASDGK